MALKKKVTPEVFKSYEIMRDAGIKAPKIAEILGVSTATIYSMKKCETYDGYRTWASENIAKFQERKRLKDEQRRRELEVAKERENIKKAEQKRRGWGLFAKKEEPSTILISFEVKASDKNVEMVAPVTALLSSVFDGVEVKYGN